MREPVPEPDAATRQEAEDPAVRAESLSTFAKGEC